jgi:hypothetical protein
MRGELLSELDEQNVTTEASRRSAAEAVRASFAKRYGAKALRHQPNLDAAFGGIGVAALALAGALGIRAYRRRTRAKAKE